MPAARKSVTTSDEGLAEANRLRSLLGEAPPVPESEPPKVLPFPDGAVRPDWSATLANITEMATLLREQGERLASAEARVQQAEARAEEAETWLRRLHQAVLDGLPVARTA